MEETPTTPAASEPASQSVTAPTTPLPSTGTGPTGQSGTQPGMNPAPTTGLAPNVAGTLAYVFGWVTGLIFYFTSKDRFVRFHAMQSILFSVVVMVLSMVIGFVGYSLLGFLTFIIVPVVQLAILVIWIILMNKAYNNQMFKLPVIGNFAESKA